MSRQIRRLWRLCFFGVMSVYAVLDFLLLVSWRPRAQRFQYQARWMHRYGRWVSALVGLRVTRRGQLTGAPVIVSNHLSYLDVFTISSQQPVIFVSMAEVKKWPWGGILARCAGTLFIDRKKNGELTRVSKEIEEIVASGVTVALFLEGATSDGSGVQPFYSSLLQPAVKNQWPVIPCCLRYAEEGTGLGRRVAWHDDQPFFEHLWQFLQVAYVDAGVSAGPPLKSTDRKALARELHEAVVRMKVELDGASTLPR